MKSDSDRLDNEKRTDDSKQNRRSGFIKSQQSALLKLQAQGTFLQRKLAILEKLQGQGVLTYKVASQFAFGVFPAAIGCVCGG